MKRLVPYLVLFGVAMASGLYAQKPNEPSADA